MSHALLIAAIILLFFALGRTFVCWYLKLTEISETLKRIEKK